MRLTGRVRRLQARYAASPTLMRAWIDLLTTLRASLAEDAARWPDDPAMNPPLYQVTDAEIAAEARYYAARGTRATFTDWFRYEREREEDATIGTPRYPCAETSITAYDPQR